MLECDLPQLQERLNQVGRVAKASFAGACAEWLFPCYALSTFGKAGVPAQDPIRLVLDAVWLNIGGEDADLSKLELVAESLAFEPDDANVLTLLAAGAATAAAHAAQAWQTNDPAVAMWAASVMYDGADTLVQSVSTFESYTEEVERELRESAYVQSTLASMLSFVAAVETPGFSPPQLREMAREQGHAWLVASGISADSDSYSSGAVTSRAASVSDDLGE